MYPTSHVTGGPTSHHGSRRFHCHLSQCFELHDGADDALLNSVCVKLRPTGLPTSVTLYKSYRRLELSRNASLSFTVTG